MPSVVENTTGVAIYTANEPVTWSIHGGADAARFTLTGGALSFTVAPNYEAPSDTEANNVYQVVIRATDVAGNTADQAITVTDCSAVLPAKSVPRITTAYVLLLSVSDGAS